MTEAGTDRQTNSTERAILALACSPTFARDGILFAASAQGLATTDDGGASWRNAFASLAVDELPVTAVALSPQFETDRTLLAATPGGIGRSVDAGETWSFTQLPLPAPDISAIAISPAFERNGLAFAATLQDGIFRSDDRGATWHAWNFGLVDRSVLAIAISPHFENDNTLFAATTTGLVRSTNAGRSWIDLNLPAGLAPITAVAAFAEDSSDVALLVGSDGFGVYHSEDLGCSWERCVESSAMGATDALSVSPDGSTICALTESGITVSQDSGQTWRSVPAAVTGAATAIALPDSETVLVGTLNGDIHRIPIR